jgi:predicted RNA-binding protein with PUA-like domain
MNYWLLKTEPSVYSFADLERDKVTVWDGIANNLALKHLNQIRKGDLILIYHTGDEMAIVGIAEAAGNPYPDPKANNPKLSVIDIKPQRRLVTPLPLATMKKERRFMAFDLIRLPRLSVVPVPPSLWQSVMEVTLTFS